MNLWDVEAFWVDLYRASEVNDVRGALRLIYDRLFRWRKSDPLGVRLCNEVLCDADVSRLPVSALLAILTVTAPLKASCPARAVFYARALARIVDLNGEETARCELVGLE